MSREKLKRLRAWLETLRDEYLNPDSALYDPGAGKLVSRTVQLLRFKLKETNRYGIDEEKDAVSQQALADRFIGTTSPRG
jgi:hypothetical protein